MYTRIMKRAAYLIAGLVLATTSADARCTQERLAYVAAARIVLQSGQTYEPGQMPCIPGVPCKIERVYSEALQHWRRGDSLLICDYHVVINKSRHSSKVLMLGVME